jgi:hypothetical protein
MRRPQAQPGRATSRIQKDATPTTGEDFPSSTEGDTKSKENEHVSFKLAALRRSFALIVFLAAALSVFGLNDTSLPQPGLRATTAERKWPPSAIAESDIADISPSLSASANGTDHETPQPLPQPIRLLRIPKAGSSSFSAFLRLQYQCTSEQNPPGDCNSKNSRVCPNVKGCSNHKPPPTDDDVPLITIFREPVSRYISAYYYPGHHGFGTGNNISLHSYLFPEYDNTMTNFLSGHAIGTWNKPEGNKQRHAPPADALLPSKADYKKRLQIALNMTTRRLSFCGLLEYWNDSLRLFCRMYQCPQLQGSLKAKAERGNRKNTTNKDTYPYNDSNAMVALQESHTYDTILYQAAQHRFCRDLQQFQWDTVFLSTISTRTLDLCDKFFLDDPLITSADPL